MHGLKSSLLISDKLSTRSDNLLCMNLQLVKIKISNTAYPSQYNDIDIPHGSRNHVIEPDTVKMTFNLDIESTDKTYSMVNNIGRALVKKRRSSLAQKKLKQSIIQIFMTHTEIFT